MQNIKLPHIITLLLLLISFKAHPQSELAPIVEDEWASFFVSKEKPSYFDLIQQATTLSDQATQKIKSGEDNASRRLILMALALTNHSLNVSDYKTGRAWKSIDLARTKLQQTLLEKGISSTSIKESNESLAAYLTKSYGANKPTQKPIGSLNIIGIYPGFSSRSDVAERKYNNKFEIGGLGFICVEEYDNDTLSNLHCPFGNRYATTYIDSPNERALVANDVAAINLIKGFSKKFGKPKIEHTPLKNKFGGDVTSTTATWQDKFGNKLTVLSIIDSVDVGLLTIESKAHAAKNKNNAVNQEY